MKKILWVIIIAIWVVILGILFSPITGTSHISYVKAQTPEEEIKDLVKLFAKQYGVDELIALTLVDCESDFLQKAIGDGGRSKGVMQYQKASFERHSKLLGEQLNYDSAYDQIKLGMWAISQGYGNEWTAYVAIKKGGKYSFYSKQLDKHFTVYCKTPIQK